MLGVLSIVRLWILEVRFAKIRLKSIFNIDSIYAGAPVFGLSKDPCSFSWNKQGTPHLHTYVKVKVKVSMAGSIVGWLYKDCGL